MGFLIGFFTVFGLMVVYLIFQARKAGPRQLPPDALARGRTVLRRTAEEPGPGWDELGSKTTADRLNLKFDHDDDPQAEATMVVPGASRGSGLSHRLTVRLGADFEDVHVHTAGYVFRVRIRGTGGVVGKEVKLLMQVSGADPYGGKIENDGDTDAAVGDWIEVESAEILAVRR